MVRPANDGRIEFATIAPDNEWINRKERAGLGLRPAVEREGAQAADEKSHIPAMPAQRLRAPSPESAYWT